MKFTADYITRRLEHAGATLICLRVKGFSTQMAQASLDVVRDFLDEVAPGSFTRQNPTPSSRDIMLMDEAFAWLRLLPNETHRRLVSLRSQYSPQRDRHVFSWRQCADKLGISHPTAKLWHQQALGKLQVALGGWEIKQPAGCNIMPQHIALHWLDEDA
jgi:hypothetical protein